MRQIESFFRIIKEFILDIGRFIATVFLFIISMVWALIKTIGVLSLSVVCGTIRGFSVIRFLVFTLAVVCGLVFKGAIFPEVMLSGNFNWVNTMLFTVLGVTVKCRHIPFIIAGIILVANSIWFVIDSMILYDVIDYWGDALERTTDFFKTTFFYRVLAKEEPFWLASKKFKKISSLYYEPSVYRRYNQIIDSAEEKKAETVAPVIEVKKDENVFQWEVDEAEKESEIKAYAAYFKECFFFEDMKEKYDELHEKYKPEGTEPDKVKFAELLKAYEGGKKWIFGRGE